MAKLRKNPRSEVPKLFSEPAQPLTGILAVRGTQASGKLNANETFMSIRSASSRRALKLPAATSYLRKRLIAVFEQRGRDHFP